MRPQLPSRIPVVLDAWLELFEAAKAADDGPLKGVQVQDGPVRKLSDVEDDAVGIGMGDQTFPGASSTLEPQPGLGPRAYAERIEVTMMLATYSGNIKMSLRRARAAELLAGVKAVIDGNQVRAGVWDQAFMGESIDWYPSQNEAGCTIEVAFTAVTRSLV